jgi:hypothetical protein
MRAAAALVIVLLAGCASRSAADRTAASPPAPGQALMVVGTIPLHGTDNQIREALESRGLKVQAVKEDQATPADAAGKRIVVLSYSMKSTEFKAEAFADLPVPIIVLEHFLLPRLGMTGPKDHGFTPSNLTQIEITGRDPVLGAGFPPGERTVYVRGQEMFWGVPSAAAIRVASIKGQPERITYFAYPRGAEMVGRTAPARRVQFFHATHAPPPVDTLYLSADGLKLLGGAIDWALQ